MKKVLIFLFLIIFIPLIAISGYEDTWDELLKKYTKEGTKNGIALTLINYNSIRNDDKWGELLKELKKSKPEGGLAFWINIYNIAAVKMMADNYPLKSIKDKSKLFNSVWDQKIINITGKEYSMSHIEHEILRKMGEPRIHAAIVCASVSCPDLLGEAYSKKGLNEQLNSQMKLFLNNTKKGFSLDKKNRKIYISSIFKWFNDDFDDVRRFISHYLPEYKNEILDKKYDIKYLDYDWASNDAKN